MISIVVTTYKRTPKIIERAIKSILAQTYKDWELIVVDDSPSDYIEREEVKKRVLSLVNEQKLTYISNEKNMGACYSRNIGLSLSRGNYIAFLDDDDEWVPEKLEKQIHVFDNASDKLALVYCPFYKVLEKTKTKKLVVLSRASGYIFEQLLNDGNIIGGMSMPLIRTECIKAVGKFDTLMQSAQDYDLWLRLALDYEIEYLDEPLVLYYEYEGERITNNPSKQIMGIERINQKYSKYINNNRVLSWKRNMCLVPFYAAKGDLKTAMSIWIKYVKKLPIKVVDNLHYLGSIINCYHIYKKT